MTLKKKIKIQRRKNKKNLPIFRQTGSHYAHLTSTIDRPVCLIV